MDAVTPEFGIRVMLVDDSQTFLNITTSFLSRYEELSVVAAVTSGQEALSRLPALRPDVILVDLEMPHITGLELIPQLRSELPEVGVIALTFLADQVYRQAALTAGADDFVPKRVLATELLPAIQRLVQNGRSDNCESLQ